jgi:CheY-like chemotaxis protein
VEHFKGVVEATKFGLEHGVKNNVQWTNAKRATDDMTTNRHILIIDDEPVVAKTLMALLKQHDYTVSLAANGRTGIDQARSVLPAVIFCDYGLPDIDGCKVVAALNEESTTTGIPVVLMSAYADVAPKAPVAAFLQKPFGGGEVLQVLEAVLPKECGQ